MIRKGIERFTAHISIKVIDAMDMINTNTRNILYLIDDVGRLHGSLSDGDIRRWILKGGQLEAEAQEAACTEVVVSHDLDADENNRLMKRTAVHSLPILDSEGRVIDILFEPRAEDAFNEVNGTALRDIDVIIMAGGMGTRLNPYTKILPKPLIPIGDIPILERITDRFHEYGANRFHITLNYKKEMIKSYFAGTVKDYEIDFVEENKPLGTAGSIALIRAAFSDTAIVTNCDILIEANYKEVLDFHRSSGNAITIVSSSKHMSLPYGIIHSKEQGIVESMEEKPSFSYFINTGMYFVNSKLFSFIPANQFYHMTDFVEDAMERGEKVGMFPISENSFLDMGELEELKKMEERFNNAYAN